MIRICSSLSKAGYDVTLVGRKRKDSIALLRMPFSQKRLNGWFSEGKLFYAEYNVRLFFYLVFRRMDAICAIDLDTILPCYFISIVKRVTRIYDAHELFCEIKEIVTRPAIYQWWKRIERYTIPRFRHGYTVNNIIATVFNEQYGVSYEIIRSISVKEEFRMPVKPSPFVLYQGAVNEGRSFETLIPAFQFIPIPLIICGDGNFMKNAQALVKQYGLEKKVLFKGRILPQELKQITRQATVGVTLFENNGYSNYISLANRFFDYLHAGVPQVCVDYPAYQEINNLHKIAVLVNNISAENLALAINNLLNDKITYEKLQSNCRLASTVLNWQNEEKKLLAFYEKIMN
jgi:glycosyltransferase involved in cell wall biosynthesis